jgi:hypothetical protein
MKQLETIYKHLKAGRYIDRVQAVRMGIGDLRSRIPELRNAYGITPDRERKPGKRYLHYYIKELVK